MPPVWKPYLARCVPARSAATSQTKVGLLISPPGREANLTPEYVFIVRILPSDIFKISPPCMPIKVPVMDSIFCPRTCSTVTSRSKYFCRSLLVLVRSNSKLCSTTRVLAGSVSDSNDTVVGSIWAGTSAIRITVRPLLRRTSFSCRTTP